VKRQIVENDNNYQPALHLIKMLKAAIKPEEFRKKVKKLTELNEQFRQVNQGAHRMFWYIQLDEQMIRRMANPIKD